MYKNKQSKNRRLEKTCLSIIKIGTYLALFAPLIVMKGSFFPFVTPKTIYFRILIEIMLAAYLVLAIYFPRYRPKLNIVGISILIFLFVLILTSFLGINFERSFWSTYERMTGIFTLLHLLAFFIILTSAFKQREDWEKILSVSILAGLFLCIYVLTQDQISTRGGGTIGNTSFMATYLLFNISFALALFFTKRDSFLKTFAGVSLLFSIPTLLMSTGRGAIVSFWGGLALLLIGYLIFSGKKNLRKTGVLIIIFLILSSLILAVYQPSFLKDIIKHTLKEMKSRFVVWEKGWKGFLERPVFGWGPENFNVLFAKFFNPCVFLSECGGEIWFDRVHNVVLDTLVTTGAVGLLSYLLMFAVSIFGLLKICHKKKENISAPLIIAILFVVYFFQNLLVFDMISSYMVFFLSLGFASFLIDDEKELDLDTLETPTSFVLSKKPVQNIILAVIVLLSASFIYFGNIQPFSSAMNTVQMVISPDDNLNQSLGFYEKALNGFMEKYEVREQFSQKLGQSAFNPDNNRATVNSAFNIAEEQMEESIRKNSLDFRHHLFLGKLYFADYRFSNNTEKLYLAEQILEKSIELSPTNQQGYWYMAEVKLAKGEKQAAFDLFEKAIELEPRFGTSHWYLATVYRITGQYEQAFEKIKDAEALGYNWKNNINDLRDVAEIYIALGLESDLISIYQEAIELNPGNTTILMDLAVVYANLGQFDKARETTQKVIELDPSLAPELEDFLKSLEQ